MALAVLVRSLSKSQALQPCVAYWSVTCSEDFCEVKVCSLQAISPLIRRPTHKDSLVFSNHSNSDLQIMWKQPTWIFSLVVFS